MKNLLIHSANTSFLEIEELYNHSVHFKIPSDTNVDHYISELITENIEPENPDTIFIKYALGSDYLAFLGLRLAHHIRLHNGSIELSNVPIIFVGEETVLELIRISDYSDILATPGIYYVNEDLNKVRSLLNRIDQKGLEGIKTKDSYFKKVNIPAPLNYDTRHNYINELSIFLWSEYLGCGEFISDIQGRIHNQLYFKYRIAKDKVDRELSIIKKLPVFNIHSKILLVDDESEKGWEIFYEHLFSDSDKVDFKVVHFDKNKSKDKILDNCIKQIKDFDPDVILLDLRLSEKDIFETEPQNLTGYSILEKIKAFNRGIQVIVTTASNKTTIFRELINAGSDDFIIKDIYPETSCSALIRSIDKSINESKVLKPIYSNLNIAFESVHDSKIPKINFDEDTEYFYNELKRELHTYLNLIQDLLSSRNATDRFSLTFLQYHKMLEVLTDYYIYSPKPAYDKEKQLNLYSDEFYSGNRTRFFIKINDEKYKTIARDYTKPLSTLQKFLNTYFEFTNRNNESLFNDLERLNYYRNNYSHPNLDEEFTTLELLFEFDYKAFRKIFINISTSFFEYMNAIR